MSWNEWLMEFIHNKFGNLMLSGSGYDSKEKMWILPKKYIRKKEVNKMLYLVMEIGCLECEIDSNVIGLFEDEEIANIMAMKQESKKGFEVKVFEIPEINKEMN